VTRRGISTGRMKESSDGDALPGQFVVELGRLARFQYVVLHAVLLKPGDRLRRRLQNQLHAARQNHDLRAVVDELGDVSDLNAGNVLSTGLAPIPWAAAAGPQFHVFALPKATNLHDSPSQVLDGGRFGMLGHAASF
jgi:hypothetical protein